MRPAGEVRLALLNACTELATPLRAPTLRELALRACVGLDAARSTVREMKRAGQIRQVRERRVHYRNRPVAEYEPAMPGAGGAGYVDLGSVLRSWGG